MSERSTVIDSPPPDPAHVQRVLAEIEARLELDQAPPLPEPAAHLDNTHADADAVTGPEPDHSDADDLNNDNDDADELGESGETRRVKALRKQVAEARRLAVLQDDDAPLLVDTAKVRKRRARVAEAARLHALTQDPAALSWRDARVRTVSTAMAMTAATIALAASSIGVQRSVAEALHLKETDPAWWAAFLAEPALSLPLLAALSVQAYSAMRGRVIDRKSPMGRKLFRTEALLLGLTLVLNCWPALPGVAPSFDLLPLLVHALGPVAAVVSVWILPTLWQVLAELPAAGEGASSALLHDRSPATPPSPSSAGCDLRGMTPEEGAREGRGGGVGSADAHRAELRRLIASGHLPSRPSARAIQAALRCREGLSRVLRDELRVEEGVR
ncbi:hypothetical protein [Nonomuraea longicatena]|uniref:Uncharacterized protein n=1 Tax=Nonomuraea longicatena TaxID=83682 RepID=A0ABP4BG83_9ACTN